MKFVADVLPKANSVELLVERKHKNNFVSLIAPVAVERDAKGLFKWDNGFSARRSR